MSYLMVKGNRLYQALGATASGDFGAVLSQQRNEARKLFGETSIHLPGRTDINYPNVQGKYAVKLIDYWRKEAQKVFSQSYRYGADVFGGDAVYKQWTRAVDTLKGVTGASVRAFAVMAGDGMISESNAKKLWVMLDNVVLPMKAVKETPSDWELVGESIIESVKELATTTGLTRLLKYAAVIGIGYIAYNEFTKKEVRMSLGETTSFSGSTVGMLRAFGINDTQATMAAAGMFWTVGGSNVHSPITQVMVRAAQRALNHLNAPRGPQIFVNGLMDKETRQGLQRVLGPAYGQMTWAGVFATLRDKLYRRQDDFVLNQEPELLPVSGLGGDGTIMGLPIWAALALGGGALWYLNRPKKRRR